MPQTTFNIIITNIATQIRSPKARRMGFSLQNTGNETVFIGFSSNVTTSSFIKRLKPDGSFDINDMPGIWRGNIYGITASSTSVISGSEWLD